MTTETEFRKTYEQYAKEVLIPTQSCLKAIFGAWRHPDYWRDLAPRDSLPAPAPIQRTTTRVKRTESAVDKIWRKPDSFPDRWGPGSVSAMDDALGGRVIIYFLSGFPLIDKALRSQKDLEIVKSEAYLPAVLHDRLGLQDLEPKNKESGYTSIHYVVKVLKPELQSDKWGCPIAEIQVRTLAEDMWAEVEHLLAYKPDKRTSLAVRKQFQILGQQIAIVDEYFDFLYGELLRFQVEANSKEEDPLNAENLPAVLRQFSIGCEQREIDGLLKILNSRGVVTVGDLQGSASGDTIKIISDTYLEEENREPNDFEIVACIAAAGKEKQSQEIKKIIKSQIAFLKGWEEVKRSMG